jgi:hypothetical protein
MHAENRLQELFTNYGKYAGIVGVYALIILISVGLISTNHYSRNFVDFVRNTSIVIVLVSAMLVVLSGGLQSVFLLSGAIYTSLFLYGLMLSTMNGLHDLQVEKMMVNYTVVMIALIFFSAPSNVGILHRLDVPYLIYVIVALLATIQSGGVEFIPLPKFDFNYASSVSGLDIEYSQGVSKFFGIGCIAAAYAVGKTLCNTKRNLFVAFYLFFLVMAFFGGGRGDSVAAFIVSVFYLFSTPGIKLIKWVLFLLLLYAVASIANIRFENDTFAFMQRFQTFEDGDYGLRDQLMVETFGLLMQNPSCILVGCGFEYFQYFYNYDFGMYPHNFIAESLISFGFLVTCIFGFLVFNGIRSYHSKVGGVDFFILYFFYDGIVALKSGELFGSWFFTAGSIYFSALTLKKLFFIRGANDSSN